MMLSSPSLRRFVRRALFDVAVTDKPEGRPETAFNMLCARLRHTLQPLFGVSAVDVLVARARHVAAQEFPWLSNVVSIDGSCAADAAARDAIDALDAEAVAEGLAAVLANIIGLLSEFVGEDLVLPLVQQAWGTVSGRAEHANEGSQ